MGDPGEAEGAQTLLQLVEPEGDGVGAVRRLGPDGLVLAVEAEDVLRGEAAALSLPLGGDGRVLRRQEGQQALELGAVALRGQDLHPELRPLRLALHLDVHGPPPLSLSVYPRGGGLSSVSRRMALLGGRTACVWDAGMV